MNSSELPVFGLRFRYYESQADVDNETPLLLVCTRAELSSGTMYIHGHVLAQEPMSNYTVGNPRSETNPASNMPPVPVAEAAAAGVCVAIE